MVLLDVDLDGLPGKAARKQCAQFIADLVPQRPRPGGQPEGHGELAVAKLDLVDLLELQGAAAGFGILEAGKGVADGGLGDGWGHDRRFLSVIRKFNDTFAAKFGNHESPKPRKKDRPAS